jgi:hypothetical protein
MVFTLLVCADVCGHKLNCEVPFAAPPTLAELRQRADQVFYEEAQSLARQGKLTTAASELLATTVAAPGFDSRGVFTDSGLLSLGRVQVYDDSLLRWVDLVSPSQLHEYDQVYVFPKHRAHLSQVRDLPPPRPTGAAVARTQVGDPSGALIAARAASLNATGASPPRAGSAGGGAGGLVGSIAPPPGPRGGGGGAGVVSAEQSPSRYRTGPSGADLTALSIRAAEAAARGFDVSVEELDKRQRQVFGIADRNNNSYLSVDDFRSLFARTKILFNDVTVTEIFAMHAANGRFMTFAEWQMCARNFPQLFAALYRRLLETQAEADMAGELELGAKRLLSLRAEIDELNRRLEAARRDVASQEQRSKDLADRLGQARLAREPVEEEEQVVLEKEARIHFQREMLLREETELRAATRRLDERAAAIAPRGEIRRY